MILTNYEKYYLLLHTNFLILILICIGVILSYLTVAVISKIMLTPLGIKLPFVDSLLITGVTAFYNLITPFKGGMAVRALYLKKKYDFAYTDFIATLAASYIIIFLVAGLTGLASSWWIYNQTGQFSYLVMLIFAGATASMFAIVVIAPKFVEPKNRWIGKFVRVINGWHLIRKNKRLVYSIGIISVIQLLIASMMLVLQFRTLGYNLSISQGLFISSVGSLSVLIAVTPAGLGINEAVTVFSAAAIGITSEQSLAAALLGRIVSVVVLFILGPICTYLLLKKEPAVKKELAKQKKKR